MTAKRKNKWSKPHNTRVIPAVKKRDGFLHCTECGRKSMNEASHNIHTKLHQRWLQEAKDAGAFMAGGKKRSLKLGKIKKIKRIEAKVAAWFDEGGPLP
jgi:hypothetical protein